MMRRSKNATATNNSNNSSLLPIIMHRTNTSSSKTPTTRRKALRSSPFRLAALGTQNKRGMVLRLGLFVLMGGTALLVLVRVHSTLLSSSSWSTTTNHAAPVASSSSRSLESFANRSSSSRENNRRLSPLQPPLDYQQFTVRINTWQRDEQLQLSIRHHASCPSVAQIQVVWCLEQGEVPDWLVRLEEQGEHTKVVVERHAENSLNERFRLLAEPPTAGILSIDDDVLRPCLALDAGFVKWTRNYDRQVGYDARSHEVLLKDDGNGEGGDNNENIRWKYAYLSTTEKSNTYSITLTRYSFLHRDYLRQYTTVMPQKIRDVVAQNFNCEDIAMSLWISSSAAQTTTESHSGTSSCRPPLLADLWAVKSQIKIYVPKKISGGHDHKGLRDDCMNDFADWLGIKAQLQPAPLKHSGDWFEYGAPADDWNQPHVVAAAEQQPSLQESMATIARWKALDDPQVLLRELGELRSEASREIYEHGLLEKTPPWKDRFGKAKAD